MIVSSPVRLHQIAEIQGRTQDSLAITLVPIDCAKSTEITQPESSPGFPSNGSDHPERMADSTVAAPKPSSSVKLVLLGEAAVGKVRRNFVA